MSDPPLPSDALESIRMRLSQISHSLTLLSAQLTSANPLPPWPALLSQFNVLLSQLTSLSVALDMTHAPALKGTLVYPTPAFPIFQQESLLLTLLRKKVTPQVQDWIDQDTGPETAAIVVADTDHRWWWAKEVIAKLSAERPWNGKCTKEELDAGVEPNADDLLDAQRPSPPPLDPLLRFISGVPEPETGN